MALPSAQLGQLPGMNSPTYIPSVVVTKEPKYWEKALIQMLAQAGGDVVGRGVTNSMSQDYADSNLGEKPNTGFSKFWEGPKVTAAEQSQRVSNTATDKRLQEQLGTELQIAGLNRTVSPRDEFTQGAETARQGQSIASQEKIAGMSSADRQKALDSETARTNAMITAENTRAQNELALKKLMETAQMGLLGQQTTAASLQNQLLKGAVDRTATGAAATAPLTPTQELVQRNAANPDYRSPFSKTAPIPGAANPVTPVNPQTMMQNLLKSRTDPSAPLGTYPGDAQIIDLAKRQGYSAPIDPVSNSIMSFLTKGVLGL